MSDFFVLIKKYRLSFFAAIIFLVVIWLLFYKLGMAPLYDWDEARHAVSANEMSWSGNYIANTWKGKFDYWNLKPPLSFILISLSENILGASVFSIRLPSVVCGMLTFASIFIFAAKKWGGVYAIFSVMLLFCFTPIVFQHGMRSADADSIYCFFTTLSVLSVISLKNSRGLFLGAFLAAMAFLTKSWHVLPLVIYLSVCGWFLNKNSFYSVIKSQLLMFFSFFIPVSIWFLARYSQDGVEFFKEMVLYDLLKRGSSTIEGHAGVFYYYLLEIKHTSAKFLFICVFVVFSGVCFLRKNFFKINVMLLWLFPLVSFFLFSLAKTKLFWYIYPSIPILCIFICCVLHEIGKKLCYITMLVTTFSFFVTAYSMQNVVRVSSYDLVDIIKEIPKDESGCVISMDKISQSQVMASNILFYEQQPSMKGFADLCSNHSY